jgi:hypothetical protein
MVIEEEVAWVRGLAERELTYPGRLADAVWSLLGVVTMRTCVEAAKAASTLNDVPGVTADAWSPTR